MDSNESDERSIYDFVLDIFYHKKLIGKALLIGIILGGLLTICGYMKGYSDTSYTTQSSMALNNQTKSGTYATTLTDTPNSVDLTMSQDMVDAAKYIAISNNMYLKVMDDLGYDLTYEEYKQSIELEAYNETQVMILTVKRQDKTEAILLNYEIMQNLPDSLQESLDVGNVQVIDEPLCIGKSQPGMNLKLFVVAMFLGVIAGIGWSMVLSIFQPRFLTKESVETNLGLEVLAEIPTEKLQIRQRGLSDRLLSMAVYEQRFATLSRIVSALLNQKGIKSIMLTSALQGEGKSTISIKLAKELARYGYRVLLVDYDTYSPVIGKSFHLTGYTSQSLNAVWNGEKRGKDAVIRVGTNLYVLQSFVAEQAQNTEKSCKQMLGIAEDYDYVIYDTPPGDKVADAFYLSECVDAAILVIRQAAALVSEVDCLVHHYEQLEIPILGVILNGMNGRKEEANYYSKYLRGYDLVQQDGRIS